MNNVDPSGEQQSAFSMMRNQQRIREIEKNDPEFAAKAREVQLEVVTSLIPAAAIGKIISVGSRILKATKILKNAKKVRVRSQTRAGKPEKQIKITDKKDTDTFINQNRVKQETPNTHAKAPPGAKNKVKMENPQPGSKGLKRDPTKLELEILRQAKEK